ncbi:hypothetical protein DFJ73DRAFT_628208 [Zopfochytrium polystomum]|nr:hypothetical protein DFJ73DRAFT_628208 [Zopfochytrium polystomum]
MSSSSNSTATGDAAVDLKSVMSAFGVHTAIAFGLIIAFSFLRPANKVVYQPRLKFSPPEKKPLPIGPAPTAWIKPILKSDSSNAVATLGLDAVMFLKCAKMMVRLFLALTCFGIPLCVFHSYYPRITGHQADTDILNDTLHIFDTTLGSLTISQIDVTSPWYWLPAGLAWVFSLIVYGLLYSVWTDYIVFRRQWFLSKKYQESLNNRLLLATNVPEVLHEKNNFVDYMNSLNLPIRPTQAVISPDVSHLEKLVKEHTKKTIALEKILAKYLKDPDNIPATRPTMTNPKTQSKVDAIEYLGSELNRLEEEIYKERAKPDSNRKATSAGFVSFPSISAAHMASRKLRANIGGLDFTSNATQMSSSLAGTAATPPNFRQCPQFGDITWDSIGNPPPLRVTYRMIALGGFVALTIVWTAITSAIASLSDLQSTFKSYPSVVDWLQRNQSFTVIVQAFLSPILLAIANYILPQVLRLLTWLQGVRSKQGMDKSVLLKLFAFFVYQIFVVSVVGSVIGAKTAGVNDPGLVTDFYKKQLTDAISGLAKKSNLYITYLLAYFSGYGIEMAQVVPLAKSFIMRRFFKLSPRQEYELNQPPQFDFTQIYGSLCMGFLIALTFSIVAPIILPFALVYFSIVFVVMKYQFMYVYEVRRETGGTWWPKVFNLLSFALGVFQAFTLVVIFAANTQAGQRQWLLVVPLPFLTGALWIASQRFLLPKVRFISQSDDSTANGNTIEMRGMNKPIEAQPGSGVGLEDMVFNPALVKPLMKVWVWQRSKYLLPSLYTPRYASLEDYLQKNPSAAQGDQSSRRHRRLRLLALSGGLNNNGKLSQQQHASGENSHAGVQGFVHMVGNSIQQPFHGYHNQMTGRQQSVRQQQQQQALASSSALQDDLPVSEDTLRRRRMLLERAALLSGHHQTDDDDTEAGGHVVEQQLEDLLPPEEMEGAPNAAY